MTFNGLPPQAYTQDTLKQAYAWMQSQTDEIKSLATTPDNLVSLYLKAKRFSEVTGQTPSVQHFKNELKSLAKEMNQFDVPESVLLPTQANSQNYSNANQIASSQIPNFTTPVLNSQSGLINSSTPSANGRESSIKKANETQKIIFDAQTSEVIETVKNRLNLSSDTEVLRMLVQLGFDRIRDILPRS